MLTRVLARQGPAICVSSPGHTGSDRGIPDSRYSHPESDFLNILMIAKPRKIVKMSDTFLAVVERESHLISIYTVLKTGYTKMMKKKVFFSERD